MTISPHKTVMKTGWLRRGAMLVAVCIGGTGLAGLGSAASAAPANERQDARDRFGRLDIPQELQGIYALSRPSAEHRVAFPTPGVISQILVKDGDPVKKDQVLAVQNEAEEIAKLEIAQYEAGKAADQYIKAAKATLEKAKVDLQRLERLHAAEIADGRSNTEIDAARAEVAVSEATLDLRVMEKEIKAKQATLQKQKLDEKRLKSPVEGFVMKIEAREGEGADMSKTAVHIVRNDPLWVEVQVPTVRAKALKVGQTLETRYADEDQWRAGKIIYVAPYANAGVRLVRLELPNPEKREAGWQMFVRLPDNLAVDKPKVQADARPVGGAPRQ